MRARIGKQPAGLSVEDAWLTQPAASRHFEQLLVRNAAPQEKREPRGQFQIAQHVAIAGPHIDRVPLDPEQELWVDQQPLKRELDAIVKRAIAAAFGEERHERRDLGLAYRTPKRPRRKPLENLDRARRLCRFGVRLTHEDLSTTRRVAHSLHRVGPADRHVLEQSVLVVPLVDESPVAAVAWLQDALVL